MKIFYTDHFVLPLPEGHPFPIAKYAMLRQRVDEAALVDPEDLSVPHGATDREILRAHDSEFLRRVQHGKLAPNEIRRIGFPWSLKMVERARRSLRMARADLAIYLSGADPYFDDRFGRLALTKAGLAKRDELVLDYCHEAGVPVAITMGGGYGRRVQDTVDIHFQTVKVATEMEKQRRRSLGHEREPQEREGDSFT